MLTYDVVTLEPETSLLSTCDLEKAKELASATPWSTVLEYGIGEAFNSDDFSLRPPFRRRAIYHHNGKELVKVRNKFNSIIGG